MGTPGALGAGRREGGGDGGAGTGCRGAATTVPTHTFLHGIRGRGCHSCSLILVSFVISLGAHLLFLGQAWTEGEAECHYRTDGRREKRIKLYTAIV